MVKRMVGVVVLLTLGTGCDDRGGGVDAGPGIPPRVVLSLEGGTVIDTQLTGTVTVSGCKKAQVQLLQGTTALSTFDYTATPTAFALQMGAFATLYGTVGLAANLALTAKVVCDDGRTASTQAQGVSFFPVASRGTGAALPTSFTANGGLAGTKVTFTGCDTSSGVATLKTVDTAGQVVASNAALPVACSPQGLGIGPRSHATGTRLLLEPPRA